MNDDHAAQIRTEVLPGHEPAAAASPFTRASHDFLYGEVWSRPGLSRRDRRWVTLTCVAAADSPQPIEDHVHAALASGDIALTAMLEFVLHFAVYCGWPKASHLEGAVARQWDRTHRERGEPTPAWPQLSDDTLGPGDWEERIKRGVEEFVDVNLVPAPPTNSPYRHAGILGFVFGHVWQRPGLTRRERRIITVACVALDDSPVPLRSHVTAALHSGDVTKEEMDEIVLQFAAYYGFAKGEALADAVEAAWAARPD
ncbi:carboxymuconolactone decarboxylase family protein [Streptomyces sp. NPDC005921]|uniref:carboxymuconolactone decarboxylase family protein n=1 Tax=Streptomyces sp. NPDC005827 TaxID=3157070 RepID=UPI0033C84CB9